MSALPAPTASKPFSRSGASNRPTMVMLDPKTSRMMLRYWDSVICRTTVEPPLTAGSFGPHADSARATAPASRQCLSETPIILLGLRRLGVGMDDESRHHLDLESRRDRRAFPGLG